MRGTILDHENILRALRSGDGDKAAHLTERHIRAFQDEIQRELAHTVTLDLPATDGYTLGAKER